jgi:hypothetical protein
VVIGQGRKYIERGRRAWPTSRATAWSTTCPSANYQIRARRHLGQGQGLRHLRPHRPLAGHAKDEVPNPQALAMWLDVNGERYADRQHRDHGLQRVCRSCQLRQPLHEPAARRHHQPPARHPAWAWARSPLCFCVPGKPCAWVSKGSACRRRQLWQRVESGGMLYAAPVALFGLGRFVSQVAADQVEKTVVKLVGRNGFAAHLHQRIAAR